MNYKLVLQLAASSLLSAGLALGYQQAAAKLPPPFQSPSATNRPQVIAKPDGVQLQVPAGFQVEEFASGFQKPRIMLELPGGGILVTESVTNGSVLLLDGANRDGKSAKKLIEGLDRPFGLAWKDNYLYVTEATSIKRYKHNGDRTFAKGKEIIPLKDFGKGHWSRTLAFDPGGTKLYVGIGSEGDIAKEMVDRRAAIGRYNPDGSGYESVATGLRNPTTIGFHPTSKQLWVSVQERDALGDELVPDYFTHVEQGGFYGWPFAYFGPNEDPRNAGVRPDLVKKTIVPDVSLGAHSAVLDWKFYTGKNFPSRYRNGAFLALHGSSNRAKRTGYSVAFIPFGKNGKPSGPVEEFLKGWMLAEDKREVWGRPVGVLELRDGSLLVSDDGSNKIWRISHKK
ncbi:MAG: PQQ-dependent sugar dehydrogenase [Bryobacteraceae bacterium]